MPGKPGTFQLYAAVSGDVGKTLTEKDLDVVAISRGPLTGSDTSIKVKCTKS